MRHARHARRQRLVAAERRVRTTTPVSVQRAMTASTSYSVSSGAKDHLTALCPFNICR